MGTGCFQQFAGAWPLFGLVLLLGVGIGATIEQWIQRKNLRDALRLSDRTAEYRPKVVDSYRQFQSRKRDTRYQDYP